MVAAWGSFHTAALVLLGTRHKWPGKTEVCRGHRRKGVGPFLAPSRGSCLSIHIPTPQFLTQGGGAASDVFLSSLLGPPIASPFMLLPGSEMQGPCVSLRSRGPLRKECCP